MPNPGSTELKRIRWRCRRGMKELDYLMLRYVDHAWSDDSEQQREVFLKLLDTEDDKLWRWSMGYETPEDEQIAALLKRIHALPR